MILVVAATARELEFVAGAETLVCGIGPVEAAATTAGALSGSAPRFLLHIGIAGATALEPPALVLGSEAVYADTLDAEWKLPRVERVRPDRALLAEARRVLPDAQVLPIATSARVGGGSVCQVEAMEGFGVLLAAARAGVPALEVRAVSNAVGERDRMLWRIDDALAALAASVPRLIEAVSA